MPRFPFLFFTAFFLFSCNQKKAQQAPVNTGNKIADSIAVVNAPDSYLNVQTDNFVEIDSSGILMFPLSNGINGRYSESSSIISKSYGSSIWNIVFLNSKTNEYHLLADNKMIIKSYSVDYNTSSYKNRVETSGYIFYSITSDDFNSDNNLTDSDPDYLFVSDKEGKNLKQISPKNSNLHSWEYVKSTNKVIFTVKKDADNNKKFEEEDGLTTYEVYMDKGTEAKEIFSTNFKNKLKVLYSRDWKRAEK